MEKPVTAPSMAAVPGIRGPRGPYRSGGRPSSGNSGRRGIGVLTRRLSRGGSLRDIARSLGLSLGGR